VRDATRLAGGEILVVNSGTAEVRIYDDATGELVRSFGRSGSGPGEFQGPDWVAVRGDTVFVFDPFQDNGRLSAFDTPGRFISSSRIALDGPVVFPDDMLDDGMLIGTRSEGSIGPGEVGYVKYTRATIRFPRDGTRVDTIAVTASGESFRERMGNGIAQWGIPFGTAPQLAHHGDRILLGNGDGFIVDVFDVDGRHLRSIRIDQPETRVTDAMVSRWIEHQLSNPFYEQNPDAAARTRRRLEATPAAATQPAYDRLIADDAGRVWVRVYARPWDSTSTWNVLDADGRWLEQVRLPGDLDVVEIGADYVLGTATDDLGVEYVRLHRIETRR